MKRQSLSFVFSLVLSLATLATGQTEPRADQTGQKKDPLAKVQKPKTTSLTGCIDQQEGGYVLVDHRTMNVVAVLEADGFPVEGFAKHMGHRVTIRGISSPAGLLPRFRVRSIETVSDTCAPQQEQGKS
jgi:hypothetical protein